MADSTGDLYYDAALEFVNEIRTQLRYGDPLPELPRGVPKKNCECPIARATGCRVGPIKTGSGEWRLETDDGGRARVPAMVKEFVRRFDLGDYPELVDAHG